MLINTIVRYSKQSIAKVENERYSISLGNYQWVVWKITIWRFLFIPIYTSKKMLGSSEIEVE